MFLRKKNIKGNEYWYLVKNEWKDGKSRQKVVQYLGKFGTFDMDKVMQIIDLDKKGKKAKAKGPAPSVSVDVAGSMTM